MGKYWTKEKCLVEAHGCKSLSDFAKKSRCAYNAAYRHGWLQDFEFLFRTRKQVFDRKPAGYWTKERCEEESRKYKFRKEFADNSYTAYRKSLDNGWIDEYCWLEDRLNNISNRSGKANAIYAYVFETLKAVYVGRTNNIKRRDKEHLFASEKYDSVIRFCKKYNTALPEAIILETGLTLNESTEKEDMYVKRYIEFGYQIINKAKCGKGSSSIGKIGIYKWTYETCYAEAKKYEYAKDFQKSRSAYNIARKNGWLKDYVWLKTSRKDNYWNETTCRQEAEKYSSRNEFRVNAGTAYRYAMNNGWINDYIWFKRPVVWNKGRRLK